MWLKKILSTLMATVCLCTGLCITAFADDNDMYISDNIAPAYETAQNPNSVLSIKGTTVTCESSTKGDDCVSITVTHTLQKYSGILWFWDDCENATWSKTVNTNTIWLLTTKSGIENGTYRLKSTFSLTNSFGKVETITIYSGEETI
mgnify:FL=1